MISLTGDVSTGKKVLEAASHSIKKTHLELGGKAPVIVFDDADIELLIEGVKRFWILQCWTRLYSCLQNVCR